MKVYVAAIAATTHNVLFVRMPKCSAFLVHELLHEVLAFLPTQ